MLNNNNTTANEYKFIVVKCRDCGFGFGVTPEQQEWLYSHSLALFTHCPECRDKRRKAKLQNRDGDNNDS